MMDPLKFKPSHDDITLVPISKSDLETTPSTVVVVSPQDANEVKFCVQWEPDDLRNPKVGSDLFKF